MCRFGIGRRGTALQLGAILYVCSPYFDNAPTFIKLFRCNDQRRVYSRAAFSSFRILLERPAAPDNNGIALYEASTLRTSGRSIRKLGEPGERRENRKENGGESDDGRFGRTSAARGFPVSLERFQNSSSRLRLTPIHRSPGVPPTGGSPLS